MASSGGLQEDLGGADGSIDAEERFHGKRGGRGGGRGGKGGRPIGREVDVSKALSKLLRHAAEEQGIKLDDEGYAPLEQVVSTVCIYLIRFYLCYSKGQFF
jgi:RNA:NAD 2'-phosphotransferase (TPT1/KptA family)